MVNTIEVKRIGPVTYQLVQFPGGQITFVIYKFEDEIFSDGKVHRVPELAIFTNEVEAREYFGKLES